MQQTIFPQISLRQFCLFERLPWDRRKMVWINSSILGQGLVLLDNSGSEIAIVGNQISQSRFRYMLPLTECKHGRSWVWNKEQDVWEHCTDMVVPRHEARTASIGI